MELTLGADSSLLGGGIVKDGTRAEDLEVVLAVVGDGGLDLTGVASSLELHVKRSGSTRRGSGSQRGKSDNTSEELHFE